MSRVIRQVTKDRVAGRKPIDEAVSMYIKFGIKLCHTMLTQDNFTEINNNLIKLSEECCVFDFKDELLKLSEKLNVTVPLGIAFIKDEDEMTNTIRLIYDGFTIAQQWASADCVIFPRE